MSVKKKEFDITYKVLVVGESTVGKTSLIRMLSHPGEELPSLVTTIGKCSIYIQYICSYFYSNFHFSTLFIFHYFWTLIGIDFVNIIQEIDDIKVRLQIW